MANSTQTAVSDGNLELVTLSFNYLDRSEISVFFDSVPTSAWEWVGVSDPIIKFTPKVPNGVTVLIKRTTDQSELRHQYSLGAKFDAPTLDESLAQVLHIVQEASEANFSGDFYGPINMHVNRIINVAPAVDPTDVPNFAQLGTYRDDAAASAVAAAASAVAAGNASRLTVGTVTTSAPGSDAEVTIVGSPGSQSVNFVLPRGAVGPAGDVLPPGGTANQFLRKVNSTDGNATWQTFGYTQLWEILGTDLLARARYGRAHGTFSAQASFNYDIGSSGAVANEVRLLMTNVVQSSDGQLKVRIGALAGVVNSGYDGVSCSASGTAVALTPHTTDIPLGLSGGAGGGSGATVDLTFRRVGESLTSQMWEYSGVAFAYRNATSAYTLVTICGRITIQDGTIRNIAVVPTGNLNSGQWTISWRE